MNIHILQHAPLENDTGAIDRWINKGNHKKFYTRLYADDPFPAIDSFDFLIILGGPMGAYEEDKYVWLIKEKEFIHQAIKAGKKILGICLGSQLLADVLGAKVYKNNKKEIGWFPVTLTPDGRDHALFAGIENSINVLHWHGDTFSLPEKSIHLLESKACTNQAFLYETHVLGLQFHFEATPDSVISMLESDSEDLSISLDSMQSSEEILNNLHYSGKSNELLFTLLDRFLAL